MEKLYTLSFYELRLLVRSRRRLLCAVCLPLVGGLFFGLVGPPRRTEFQAAYGLFLVLPASAVILAAQGGVARLVNPLAGRLLRHASWALAGFAILALQSVLYTVVAVPLAHGSPPGFGMLIGALAASLVLGLIFH